MPDANDWHEQTMKRVRLLRLLFPNHDTFGAEGLGVKILTEQLGHIPTLKRIPAKSLPIERTVRLNATFTSLVSYRHRRPNTWQEYVDVALTFREAVSACFRKLHRVWSKLLSESPPKKNTIKQLPGMEMDQIKKLSKLPMFPRSAVDEWGFISEEKLGKGTAVETRLQMSLRRFSAWRKAFSDFESGVIQVIDKIINLTVLYVGEHKGHIANEEDDKTAHLFLLNLGDVWKSLRSMQREFRNRFGGLCSQQRIDELDLNERVNLRHFWAVAIAICYERQLHISNIGQRIENEIENRKSLFIQSIQTELNVTLGNSGSATVQETPWVIDGTPHLCIVIDYYRFETDEPNAPRLVEAIWRAAQVGGWRELEWMPLEFEWPKIALVNLVDGKALLPACATFSTGVLFATSEAFEVKFHHHVQLPVTTEDFTFGGFRIWESPLIRAVLILQGHLVEFTITNIRFYELATLVLEQKIEQDDVDRILDNFSRELLNVLTVAQRSYSLLIHILETVANENKEYWTREFRRICHFLLFDLDENSTVSLNLDTFSLWLNGLHDANSEFQSLTSEVIIFALEKEKS